MVCNEHATRVHVRTVTPTNALQIAQPNAEHCMPKKSSPITVMYVYPKEEKYPVSRRRKRSRTSLAHSCNMSSLRLNVTEDRRDARKEK